MPGPFYKHKIFEMMATMPKDDIEDKPFHIDEHRIYHKTFSSENKDHSVYTRIFNEKPRVFPVSEASVHVTPDDYKKLQKIGLTTHWDQALTAKVIGTVGKYRFRVLKDKEQYGIVTNLTDLKEDICQHLFGRVERLQPVELAYGDSQGFYNAVKIYETQLDAQIKQTQEKINTLEKAQKRSRLQKRKLKVLRTHLQGLKYDQAAAQGLLQSYKSNQKAISNHTMEVFIRSRLNSAIRAAKRSNELITIAGNVGLFRGELARVLVDADKEVTLHLMDQRKIECPVQRSHQGIDPDLDKKALDPLKGEQEDEEEPGTAIEAPGQKQTLYTVTASQLGCATDKQAMRAFLFGAAYVMQKDDPFDAIGTQKEQKITKPKNEAPISRGWTRLFTLEAYDENNSGWFRGLTSIFVWRPKTPSSLLETYYQLRHESSIAQTNWRNPWAVDTKELCDALSELFEDAWHSLKNACKEGLLEFLTDFTTSSERATIFNAFKIQQPTTKLKKSASPRKTRSHDKALTDSEDQGKEIKKMNPAELWTELGYITKECDQGVESFIQQELAGYTHPTTEEVVAAYKKAIESIDQEDELKKSIQAITERFKALKNKQQPTLRRAHDLQGKNPNDPFSMAMGGLESFFNIFDRLADKHPCTFFYSTALYAIAGLAAIRPEMVEALGKSIGVRLHNLTDISVAAAEAMSRSEASRFISAGFTAFQLAFVMEVASGGADSVTAEILKFMKEHPITVIAASVTAYGTGWLLTSGHADIPGFSDMLREDLGTVPAIEQSFAGLKCLAILFELLVLLGPIIRTTLKMAFLPVRMVTSFWFNVLWTGLYKDQWKPAGLGMARPWIQVLEMLRSAVLRLFDLVRRTIYLTCRWVKLMVKMTFEWAINTLANIAKLLFYPICNPEDNIIAAGLIKFKFLVFNISDTYFTRPAAMINMRLRNFVAFYLNNKVEHLDHHFDTTYIEPLGASAVSRKPKTLQLLATQAKIAAAPLSSSIIPHPER